MEVFGTLGFTPQKLIPTIRERDDVTRAVVFHDKHPDGRKAAQEVARFCAGLGVPCRAIEVDAFDIISAAARMQEEVRRAGATNVVFNVTGGTKVLTAAAVLACVLEGVSASYVHEETQEEIRLPLVTIRYENILGSAQRRLLRHVDAHPGISPGGLVTALGITKPTISHHVKRLVAYGLLEQRQDADDARRRGLHLLPSARLLLADPPGQDDATAETVMEEA